MLLGPDDVEAHYLANGSIEFPWNGIEALVQGIELQRKENLYIPDRILSLGRGGMVPARLLARGNTPVFYEGVCSYEGQDQTDISTYQQCREALNSPGTLIVDDLWDSGETFRYAKKLWPEAKTAALLSKVDADETFLDYIGLVLPTTSWIVFPWE